MYNAPSMQRLGPFELVRELAVGGMAELYLAKTTGVAGFEKYVALKTIHSNFAENPDFIAMLVNEAKLAVQLSHPNIAQTFDLGRVGDTYYMTMEYVDGIDVFRLLRAAENRDLQLPFGACALIAHDLAAALDHAHSRCDVVGRPLGVVHRDVSPQNVMISYDGVVKLVDFGIAKASNFVRQTDGGITGKLYYLSPEQARGAQLDARSDIYSAGIVLYEMITGHPLYVETEFYLVLELSREGNVVPPSKLRPDVPPELERIVLRALEPQPERRYQHAGEFATDLHQFLRARALHFSGANLSALIADLLERPTNDTDPLAGDSVEFRRLNDAEVAHAVDSIFDQNSVIQLMQAEPLSADTAVTRLDDPPPELASNRFGAFEVHEQLGGGALATVHRATLDDGREVALKRLPPDLADDATFTERFDDELRRVSRLRHPNLVELVEFGRVERVHFVAMELVRGATLGRLLLRRSPAPIGVALSIIAQLVDALVVVHQRAVHGDLTPANLMITTDGTVKLADLGIARALRGMAPIATAKLGYIAPETATSTLVDARTDVFAVGAIAWELIAGRPLFAARGRDALLEQLRALEIPPPSRYNEDCDASLDRTVLAALARRRDERMPSAVAFRDELRAFGGHAEDGFVEVAAWAGARLRTASDPEIQISIEDPSKVIEIAFLGDPHDTAPTETDDDVP